MNRKILISLIVITLSTSAGIVGYLLGSPKQLNLNQGTILDKFDSSDSESIKSEELIQKRRLTAVSRQLAVSPTNSSQKNKILYYEKTIGRVFQTDVQNGEETVISEEKLPNFIRTIWSPNKREVISEFRTANGSQLRYYNYDTRQVAPLSQNIRSVVFSPDGQEIAYFKTQGESGSVYLALSDGSNPKKILDTRISDINLVWPSAKQIIMQTNPNSTSDIIILSPEGSVERIITEQKLLHHTWSPSGNNVLFSAMGNGGTPILKSMNIRNRTIKIISLETTADKCAWSIDERSVFCAVPKSTMASEDIFQVDTSTGEQKLIFTSDLSSPPISVQNPFFNPTESYLIFLNGVDDRIYSLKL